ncbi:FAD-dependent monooxygenase terC [Exophiala dermatitidis]
MASNSKPNPWVIIVGAGPSGLLLELLLAKRGIPVQILDFGNKLDEQPRATHYGPPAMYELRRAGVTDDLRAAGFLPNGVAWRKLDGTFIAGVDATVNADDPDRMVCLPLNKLGRILYDHLSRYPSATVSWGHKVVSIGQDAEKAWVNVETPEGDKTLEASYIVGCDGANSQIRRSLFGDKEFPGKTWDEQIVATNTYYDFSRFGWHDSNFIIHPEHWYMAAKIGKDGLYRITYGELPGLTHEQLRERQPWKFEAMLPGHPKPDEYRIVNFSPYRIHQRLAPSMRVGRFCLAADAAHLCNPFGGMGLTGGIVDIGGLYDCLAGIYEGLADDSILDKYSEIRMQKYNDIINPISSDNIVRLFGQDPDKALENDEFLKMCKRAETDVEFARQMQNGVNVLKHDFTQYYNKAPAPAPTPDKIQAGNDGVSQDHAPAQPPVQAAAVGVTD